jgi:TolB protein
MTTFRGITVAFVIAATAIAVAPHAALGKSSSGCTTAPTTIDVWHTLSEADATVLKGLARVFERAHPNVRVKLEAKGSPLDATNEFFNTPSANRPAVVMLPGLATQAAVDTGSVATIAPCDAGGENTIDQLLRGTEAGAVSDHQLRGVPFGASGWVLVYDQAAFRRAGLDPNRPPTTLNEVDTASRALVASGATRHGLAVTDPTPLAIAAGALRSGGPDLAARREELLRWEDASLANGLTVAVEANTGAPGVNALVNREAGMAIESTLALPAAVQALRQGQAPGVELGVAAVPSPAGASTPFETYAWFLSSGTPRNERDSGWSFIEWLSQPEQQARIGGGTDFFPANASVTATTPVDRYATEPTLKRAWSVISGSNATAAEPSGAVRDREIALAIAFWSFFRQNATVDTTLADATTRIAQSDAFYDRNPAHYAQCGFAQPPCTDDVELYTVTAKDGTERHLARELTGDTPVWSPDGTRLAYATGGPGATESHLVVMNADGTHRVQVTSGSGVDRHPEWSSDGTRLVFQRGPTGFGGDIYVVDVETVATTRLTKGDAIDQQPTWSPDGRHIAYASNRGGSSDLWIMDADGSNPNQVITNRTDDWWPAWSPDGSQLAFMSDRTGDVGVYLVNVDGTNEHRLVSQPVSVPAWSPDGRTIAVVDGLTGEVYLVASDGSSARRLTTSRGGNFAPSWSPDGSSLVMGGTRRG